jgi:hypothetical protein
MSNAYAALKSEMVRIARREARSETTSFKKTVAQHRTAISTLKEKN